MMQRKNNADKWQIRFGQLFQKYLEDSGKNLEDYFYFIPSELELDQEKEESFDLIDLHVIKALYKEHFSSDQANNPSRTEKIAERLNSCIIIVPGFGHHLIKQKAFGEQIPFLEGLGFHVLYAKYENSFKSNKQCAQEVYDIIKGGVSEDKSLIFLTYSKGSPVVVELLANSDYSDVTSRTKAVVSFAGALRGSILASSSPNKIVLKLLKAYRKIGKKHIGITLKIFNKLLGWISAISPGSNRYWRQIFNKIIEFAEDMEDLPDGIVDLMIATSVEKYSNVKLPHSIKLFSISAIYPESEFRDGIKFISNLDDLFLYVSGREMYKHSVFNDTQVLLDESQFFPDTGEINNLGAVRTDHWGISMPSVFSKKYKDTFPRTEMLNAVLVLLDEYSNSDKG